MVPRCPRSTIPWATTYRVKLLICLYNNSPENSNTGLLLTCIFLNIIYKETVSIKKV